MARIRWYSTWTGIPLSTLTCLFSGLATFFIWWFRGSRLGEESGGLRTHIHTSWGPAEAKRSLVCSRTNRRHFWDPPMVYSNAWRGDDKELQGVDLMAAGNNFSREKESGLFLDFVPLLILVVVVYKDLPTHLYDSFLFVTFFRSWDLLQKMQFPKTLKSCWQNKTISISGFEGRYRNTDDSCFLNFSG